MTNKISAQREQALELHNKILVSAALAQQNLWDMCSGLKQMRDGKLYKELGYQNFEEYCNEEFSMSRRNAYHYISVVENISPENVKTFSHFGRSKLMLLSTLSEPEQEKITEENDVESMTVRELEKEIRELKDRNSQQFIELGNVKQVNDELKKDYQKVTWEKESLESDVAELEEKVKELETRPIEVAVAEPSEDVRRLKETIKSLERSTEEQMERMENEHIEDIKKLHAQRNEEMEKALEAQQREYEEKLKNAAGRSEAPDDRQVFKAYFTAAYDAFNRMLDFAKASPNKDFFKDKINKLITSMELSWNTL